jgi:hypothetical protein
LRDSSFQGTGEPHPSQLNEGHRWIPWTSCYCSFSILLILSMPPDDADSVELLLRWKYNSHIFSMVAVYSFVSIICPGFFGCFFRVIVQVQLRILVILLQIAL